MSGIQYYSVMELLLATSDPFGRGQHRLICEDCVVILTEHLGTKKYKYEIHVYRGYDTKYFSPIGELLGHSMANSKLEAAQHAANQIRDWDVKGVPRMRDGRIIMPERVESAVDGLRRMVSEEF